MGSQDANLSLWQNGISGLLAVEGPFEMWQVLPGLQGVCGYHPWVCGFGHSLYTLQFLSFRETLPHFCAFSPACSWEATQKPGPLLAANPPVHVSLSLLNNHGSGSQIEAGHDALSLPLSPGAL